MYFKKNLFLHALFSPVFCVFFFFLRRSEGRTWEAGREVLHQSLLVDRLVGRVHRRDGQAQDLPQRDELRLADR